MCGITGLVMSKKVRTDEELEWIRLKFSNLMRATQVRGEDATGAFVINKDSVEYYKAPKPASEMILEPRWWGLMDKITSETLGVIGHTRYATHGEPDNNDNNHPICIDKIIGVHNGIIQNHELLKDKYWNGAVRRIASVDTRYDSAPEVDSAAIFTTISAKSPKGATTETIAESLGEIHGDMAIVLVDTRRTDSIFVARDSGRPLIFTHCNKRGVLFMASTASILSEGLGAKRMDTFELPANTVARLNHRHGAGARIKATRWFSKIPKLNFSASVSAPRLTLADLVSDPLPNCKHEDTTTPIGDDKLICHDCAKIIDKAN